jgi:hypothetical protein
VKLSDMSDAEVVGAILETVAKWPADKRSFWLGEDEFEEKVGPERLFEFG